MVAGDHLSLIGIAIVTAISCTFGMLSSASRLTDVKGTGTKRALLMNGGAVWIAAYAIALFSGTGLSTTALIGLGVGLAGTKVLEVIESGMVAFTRRTLGERQMTREEVAEMIGDARNDAAAAIAETNVKRRRDRDSNNTRSIGQDARMDGIERDKATDHKVINEHIQDLEGRQQHPNGNDQ